MEKEPIPGATIEAPKKLEYDKFLHLGLDSKKFRENYESLEENIRKELSTMSEKLFEAYIRDPKQGVLTHDEYNQISKDLLEKTELATNSLNPESELYKLLQHLQTSIREYQTAYSDWIESGQPRYTHNHKTDEGNSPPEWSKYIETDHKMQKINRLLEETIGYYETDNEWMDRYGETQDEYHERVLGGIEK